MDRLLVPISYLDKKLHQPRKLSRYKWRYDEVLCEIAEMVDKKRESRNKETRSSEKMKLRKGRRKVDA